MRKSLIILIVEATAGLVTNPVYVQESRTAGPSPYDIVDNWAKPFAGEGFAFVGNSGVVADSPNRIIRSA